MQRDMIWWYILKFRSTFKVSLSGSITCYTSLKICLGDGKMSVLQLYSPILTSRNIQSKKKKRHFRIRICIDPWRPTVDITWKITITIVLPMGLRLLFSALLKLFYISSQRLQGKFFNIGKNTNLRMFLSKDQILKKYLIQSKIIWYEKHRIRSTEGAHIYVRINGQYFERHNTAG